MVSDIKNDQTVRMESLDHYIYIMITSDLSLSHDFKQLFIVNWFIILLHLDLKRWTFVGICGEIMSPSDFVIVARTHAYSFSRLMVVYFELVELSMNLGNIVKLGRPEIFIRPPAWLLWNHLERGWIGDYANQCTNLKMRWCNDHSK